MAWFTKHTAMISSSILDLLLQLVELRPLPPDHEAHRGPDLHHPLAPLDVEDLAALAEKLLLHPDNVSQLDELQGPIQ